MSTITNELATEMAEPESSTLLAPDEVAEWIEAFDEVLDVCGPQQCLQLLSSLMNRAKSRGMEQAALLNTPYRNSIAPHEQPAYPGDLELEKKLTALIRWNALAMVMRPNRDSSELGGHLASYASAADLFEVGFHHFFRGNRDSQARTADMVFFQPHSAPGVYARAFLEGRLTEENLRNYRSEVGGRGLSSYPHPRLMPNFWEFPTGSMGLGPIMAVYQARMMRYLENRGLVTPSDRKVWAFVGDGEMDEPESLAGLSLAARESLDNLIFVVNCNLQRLDGPVRGNGSVVHELERLYTGMGWNVIKLLWGSGWDELFELDKNGVILERLRQTVDGELQTYAASDGAFNRERFFNKSPELRDLAAHLSDEEIDQLTRGGHDPVKIHAAFHAAVRHKGRPTVILAQTKKGFGLGRGAEGRMSAHQHKKLNVEALRAFRERFELPLSDEDMEELRFLRPSADSPEMRYLQKQRADLGGFVPMRTSEAASLVAPEISSFGSFCFEQEAREMSTTVAFVRMLSALLKDPGIGKQVVPIVADEARTFGIESLFRRIGIYSHCGQLYEPEDQTALLPYKESVDGQILEEGINEAGALASWIAAGTAYSNHGTALLPVYIFYSMFGFQRVADLIWAAADSRARGFLVGATAGRTTLSGEGLQHQDGSSHLVASTVPACRAYDPCFAYEVGVILEHGMKVMMEEQEDVFFYLTLMNENYVHEAMPAGSREGIMRGMYRIRTSDVTVAGMPKVQLLGSGTILREVLAAAVLLQEDWGVAADVWSVTSFTELRRTGLAAERTTRNHSMEEPVISWVEECLGSTEGPIVAATDYVRAVPDLIRTWVPRRYVTLGTDGFGRSDTRAALRGFFEVNRLYVAFTALTALVAEKQLEEAVLDEFIRKNGMKFERAAPWEERCEAARVAS